jgi:hypothetical protein
MQYFDMMVFIITIFTIPLSDKEEILVEDTETGLFIYCRKEG